MTAYGETLRRVSELRSQARTMSLHASRLLQIADELLSEAGERSDQLEIEVSLSQVIRMKPRLEHEHEMLLAGFAESLYRQRRQREKHFDKDLFGEPAWDMLLDLFMGRVRGKQISVTSACTASNLPQSTALRWLNYLVKVGLIEREDSQFDGRTSLVKLTEEGAAKMRGFLLEKSEGSTSRSVEPVRLAEHSTKLPG